LRKEKALIALSWEKCVHNRTPSPEVIARDIKVEKEASGKISWNQQFAR